MGAFRRLGEAGFIDPDSLALVSRATRLRRKDIEALEEEFAMLEEAGLPTADARAGKWARNAASFALPGSDRAKANRTTLQVAPVARGTKR